jgi:Transcription initiation factor IID, 18kD subunit
MMYGFGDEAKPRLDSIKLMEEMVIEYISGLVAKVGAPLPCAHSAPYSPCWRMA